MFPNTHKYSINELNQMAHDYRHGAGSYERQNTVLYNFLQNATYTGGNSNNYSSTKTSQSNNFYDNSGFYTSSRLM
jgi:hypothetical protein